MTKAKSRERIAVKMNSAPDLQELFSNMAYLAAKYAVEEKDLASRLVFFLCAVETIYNLILDKKLDSTSYNPADCCKYHEPTDDWHGFKSKFNHPLDRVWESVMKQISFRLETGSWYQLPIAPDRQFSFLYKLIVRDVENEVSSKLAAEFKIGSRGRGKAKVGVQVNKKPSDGNPNNSKIPLRVNPNPQPPLKPTAPSQIPRKAPLPDKHRAAPQRKLKTGRRSIKNVPESMQVESSRTALPPPLPNKTVRSSTGPSGDQERGGSNPTTQAPQAKRNGAGIRPSKGTTGYLVLTDATGDPMPEMYEYIHDAAVHITKALPYPSQWSSVVMYLLACLEANTEIHHPLDSTLDNICRLITRRLNKGKWT